MLRLELFFPKLLLPVKIVLFPRHVQKRGITWAVFDQGTVSVCTVLHVDWVGQLFEWTAYFLVLKKGESRGEGLKKDRLVVESWSRGGEHGTGNEVSGSVVAGRRARGGEEPSGGSLRKLGKCLTNGPYP